MSATRKTLATLATVSAMVFGGWAGTAAWSGPRTTADEVGVQLAATVAESDGQRLLPRCCQEHKPCCPNGPCCPKD
jgi:hypothetical protein